MKEGLNTVLKPCNTRIGTQIFSPLYKFTEENSLVEAARGMLEMGSEVIKFSLSPFQYQMAAKRDGLPYWEVAALPEYRTVFELPFRYYILWVHDKGTKDALHLSMKPEDEKAVYQEMYDLTCYLLKEYDGTGKVFLLGHWEGDWVLLGGYDTTREPEDSRIEGMIRSLKVRQKAVEDARKDTPHSQVYVGHFCEVNRPLDAKDFGMKRMTTHVLPQVEVDMVSYSSYDALKTCRLEEALSFIEKNACTTSYFDGIFEKKVFVGEYDGYQDYVKYGTQSPEKQADNAWYVIEAAVSWGAPFVLYWEFYSNGTPTMPPEEGFWLIDRNNVKQPVYELHRDLLQKLKLFCSLYREHFHREPSERKINEAIRGLREKTLEELRREFS